MKKIRLSGEMFEERDIDQSVKKERKKESCQRKKERKKKKKEYTSDGKAIQQ